MFAIRLIKGLKVKPLLIIICLINIVCTTGCASIISDSSYPVTIVSCPPGAEFEVKNYNEKPIHSGITPSTVALESGNGYFSSASYTISISKAGYQPTRIDVESSFDMAYLGNLFYNVLGILIVDPLSGAMWKLPRYQSVSLEQEKLAGLDATVNKENTDSINLSAKINNNNENTLSCFL